MEKISIKKKELLKYSAFIGSLLLVVVLVMLLSGNKNEPSDKIVDVGVSDDAVLGDKNAPVTIIEFSDYECPFCARFWKDTLPQIKTQYINTGKAKLIYRDFPIASHPSAHISAQATECVREQGGDEAFWKYHDTIFENQAELNKDNLLEWATEMNYDIKECLDTQKYKAEVDKDLADGQALGVSGTPSFFINGKSLNNAQSFKVFKQVIDAELIN